MSEMTYDLCIIGGGINGTGIARDAVGRGLSVLLVEAQDLANATSSASTKLIHGGLRYLEYYEFRLVREALKERTLLITLAPHIIRPLEFILPHDRNLRPAWMIRAGLFLYDHLGGKSGFQKSRGVTLRGGPLEDHYTKGFSYADCWVDDARLVVLNALDAAERGATILTRTACTGLAPESGRWRVSLQDMESGRSLNIHATKVVNAAGPWVHGFLEASNLTRPNTPHIRLVKGSHIIVKRLYDGAQSYILQQPDRRIVFAIPYEHDYTLIGTTDVDYTGDPAEVAIDKHEIDYLCGAVNRSFFTKITPAQIVRSYSGVRPLFDDGHGSAAAVTRDYKLVIDESFGPPILSVFGGKITTYRKLAEQAVDELCGGESWTATAALPGGDIHDFEAFVRDQQIRYPWLPAPMLHRYARAYGTRMNVFLDQAAGLAGLGKDYGDHIYEAEIRYLIKNEWVRTAEDVLWRRSKLALHVSAETATNLERAVPRLAREITS